MSELRDLALWWAAIIVTGWAAAPLARRVFRGFADRGLGLAKPFAIVLVSGSAWLLTSLGLPHGISLWFSVAGLGAAGCLARRRCASFGGADIERSEWTSAEATFAISFLIFGALRALDPKIFGAEKFMDFAFFNSCLLASDFPPEDPWLAGAAINYYYFGYLMFADVARATAVSPEIAYNLSIATLGAFLFTGIASITRTLTQSRGLGLASGAVAVLAGNLDGARQLWIERTGFGAFDAWRSTRVIPDTINEFPFFTVLHGDLHPHLTATTILLTLIGAIVAGARAPLPFSRDWPRLATIALGIGGLMIANPWDLPVVLSFFALAEWSALAPSLRGAATILARVIAVTFAGLVFSLPFALHFDAPLQGVGLVSRRTELGPFLLAVGGLLAPAVMVAAASVRDRFPRSEETRDLATAGVGFGALVLGIFGAPVVLVLTSSLLVFAIARTTFSGDDPERAPYAVLATGTLALVACELVFLRDSYGAALERMNTVFKLYFQAWIFLSIVAPYLAVRLLALAPARTIRRDAITTALALLVGASLCYPIAWVVTRARSAEAISLDGTGYLDREHPADAAAIEWLRAHAEGRPVIVEATGDPYSYFARFSANTGLPTVLGWANHEGVWRGSDPRIEAARRDVEAIYRSTHPEEIAAALRRHRVRYVVVGELERRGHAAAGLEKFDREPERFTRVFQSGSTIVYEVRSPSE